MKKILSLLVITIFVSGFQAIASAGWIDAYIQGYKTIKYPDIQVAELQDERTTGHEHHSHSNHYHGRVDSSFLNPAMGDDIYHTHPAGTWMINYKYMHMDMSGLRHGTDDVSQSDVGFMRGRPYEYMMIPQRMIMDMHMLMIMYGITDRFTLMIMPTYKVNEMKMLMDMGMDPVMEEPPMRTSGFGDTELRGIYKMNEYITGSLGIELPTGSIEEDFKTMGMTFRAPYDMQLGSGTYNLKPAITYNDISNDGNWNWGVQAMYTYHINKNSNDWSYGDNLRITAWLQRKINILTPWLRLAYEYTGKIKGEDPEIKKLLDPAMGAPMPDAEPDNYGGKSLDSFIGLSYQKGPFGIGLEAGIPLYQDLNGLQLKTKWMLNAGIQIIF